MSLTWVSRVEVLIMTRVLPKQLQSNYKAAVQQPTSLSWVAVSSLGRVYRSCSAITAGYALPRFFMGQKGARLPGTFGLIRLPIEIKTLLS